MYTTRVRAKIQCTPLYPCSECGRYGEGSMMTIEYDGAAMESLSEYLSTVPLTPSCMPIGWASNGIYEYTCPGCQTSSAIV